MMKQVVNVAWSLYFIDLLKERLDLISFLSFCESPWLQCNVNVKLKQIMFQIVIVYIV